MYRVLNMFFLLYIRNFISSKHLLHLLEASVLFNPSIVACIFLRREGGLISQQIS